MLLQALACRVRIPLAVTACQFSFSLKAKAFGHWILTLYCNSHESPGDARDEKAKAV